MQIKSARRSKKKINMRNLDFPHSLFLDRAKFVPLLERDVLDKQAVEQEEQRQITLDNLTDQVMQHMIDTEIIPTTE